MNHLSKDVLAKAGRAMYGDQWQSPLARALGINDRTVRRWASGESNVPQHMHSIILGLMDARIASIGLERSKIAANAPEMIPSKGTFQGKPAMKVHVYEYTPDGGEKFIEDALFTEVMPEANAEQALVWQQLRDVGRAWIGGGASPLFLLMRAERPAVVEPSSLRLREEG